MGSEYAIEVYDVKKKFKVYYDKGKQLKERVLFAKRNRYEDKWVLNGISFKIKKGEAVGLIGHNGCGKSTMLKMLTRIMYPDGGRIVMNGRVSSLIELGAGFHPDMSGRENIYINASIFGLSRAEIDARLNDIIAFSELEKYIDNPVRTYSSGMYMRLAFSVAINVDADILLIDEILAVGDVNFQDKCLNKLQEIKRQGTTIVLVSHSMSQIESICERCIWIHDGLKRAEGIASEVNVQYLDYMMEQRWIKAEKQNSAEGTADADESAEEDYVQEAKDIEEGTYGAIFDANFYYNLNSDLASQIGRDAAALLSHFLKDGMLEGRQGSPEFVYEIYRDNYEDLRQEFGGDKKKYYMHYVTTGKADGRVANRYVADDARYGSVFDAQYYLKNNPDVSAAVCGSEDGARNHFFTFGMKEGRRGSEEFDPKIYRTNYVELYKYIRDNFEQYYAHYMMVGKEEGRNGSKPLVKLHKQEKSE